MLKQEVVSLQETLAESERHVSEMKYSKETIEEEHRSVTIKLVTMEESLCTAATELEQAQCELQIKVDDPRSRASFCSRRFADRADWHFLEMDARRKWFACPMTGSSFGSARML